MAHLEKYTAAVTGHMFAHYDRLHPGKESEIDETRTRLNYNLAANDQPLSQQDFLKKRLSEIKVMKRADVNVMCDWIVTAPEKLTPEEHEKFFLEVYSFLNDRYGKENVISAYVHMDETTPHVHYSFVPVVTDKKKGILKLSAKERITKGDLKSFHSDLTKRMTEVFGRDIGILNGATVGGNLTTKELKRKSEALKNFQAVPIEAETTLLTKIKITDKVVVKRSELARVNKAVTDAQIICENSEALIAQIDETKKKADRTLERCEEKAEQIITEAQGKAADAVTEAESKAAEIISKAEHKLGCANERSADLDKRESKVKGRETMAAIAEHNNNAAAEENAAKAAEIEIREQACEDKERELRERTDSPERYYRELYQGKYRSLERTIAEKDSIIAEQDRKITLFKGYADEYEQAFKDELHKSSDLEFANKALTEQIAENDKKHKKELADKDWECKQTVERNDRSRKKFFDDQLAREREHSEQLEKTIDRLKRALNIAYGFIRDICMAVSAVVWSKAGTKYHADLPDESETLLKAVSNLGEKVTAEAGYNALSEEIRNNYGIKASVSKEIEQLEQKEAEQYYPVRSR